MHTRATNRTPRRAAIVGTLGLLALLVQAPGALAKTGPVTTFTPQTGGSYDYGIVTDGSHSDQTFTLTNSGGTATAALKVSLTGSSAFSKLADTCAGASLGPAKKCAVTVRYAPTGGTTDTATLTATSTKPAAKAVITLNGKGGYVDVEFSPSSRDFGSSSGTETFTATNDGNLPSGTYTFAGPTDEHFGLGSTNTCDGSTLAPGASCSFDVGFTAPTCGGESTLYEDTASLGTLASVSFKGEQPVCKPEIVISPCGYVYTDAYACEYIFAGIGDSETFTFTNEGKGSTGVLDWTFTADGTAFRIEPPSGPDDCQNVSKLGVGESCTVTMTDVGVPADDTCPSPDTIFSDDIFAEDETFGLIAEMIGFGSCPS